METTHLSEAYEVGKKHNDLSLKLVDKDVFIMLKILLYDFKTFIDGDAWNFPPKDVLNKMSNKVRAYNQVLIESYTNNWPLNGHIVVGMSEILEKMIEDNINFIRKSCVDGAYLLRDRASAIYVSMKMFELEDIHLV